MTGVELSLIGVDEDDIDVDMLARGVARLGSMLARPDDVRVTVAGDFEQAVRDRVPDKDYAERYKADRIFGRAAAKAIPQPDGSTELVIDAWLVSKVSAPEGHDIERLFQHEGLHIAVDQRGESANDIRIRNDIVPNSYRGYFGASAGILVEEYRTEKALCDAGLWPHADYIANFQDAVEAFAAAAMDGVTLRYPDEPIDRCFGTVLTAFGELVTYTGYVASEIHASDGERTPAIHPPIYQRYLGAPWEAVIAALKDVPAADTPTPRETIDAHVWKLADLLAAWLEYVGFTLTDLDEGAYFDVLRHDFEPPYV